MKSALAALLLVMACGPLIAAEEDIAVSLNRLDEGFVVDAAMTVPVSPQTAWDVLSDYDHMSEALPNITVSRVFRRDGNVLGVRQEGAVRYGLLTISFQSEREIRLEPPKRILARQLSGSAKRMSSETHIEALAAQPDHPAGVRITYRAEVVPESFFARLFGGPFVRDSIEEQFRHLLARMRQREAAAK